MTRVSGIDELKFRLWLLAWRVAFLGIEPTWRGEEAALAALAEVRQRRDRPAKASAHRPSVVEVLVGAAAAVVILAVIGAVGAWALSPWFGSLFQ